MPLPTFFIKRPNKTRKSFALVRRDTLPAGKKKNTTLDLPEVDDVNRSFLGGRISPARAFQMMEQIKADQFKERDRDIPRAVFASVNLKIKDEYFTLLRKTKHNVDWKTLKAEITRAVEAAGELSLISASQIALQEHVNAAFDDDPNKQRRVVSRLNSILAYLGRGFKLARAPEEFTEIRHLTEKQLNAALAKIDDDKSRLLIKTAFYTGCRLGECFAIRPEHVKKNHVFVAWQIDDNGKRRQTKNRKRRNAYVVPAGRDAVRQWAAVSPEDRAELRGRRWAEVVSKAVGDDDIVFHSLRHSYAYELAMRGAGLDDISRYLGNSVVVCEKYYLGWIQEERGMEALDAAFNAAAAK